MQAKIGRHNIEIDKTELWRLKKYKYYAIQKNERIYFNRHIRKGKDRKHSYLHREIINTPTGQDCDHINGNTLDCRKINLRNCTRSQNLCNTKTPITNTSGYKGVTWDKSRMKWKAQIKINQKSIHLGRFITISEAIKARNDGMKIYHGQYGRIA